MNFKPFNKRILIERIDENEQPDSTKTGFYIPPELEGEYKKQKEFEVVRVLNFADDCTIDVDDGPTIVVLSHMIEKIEVDKETFLVIPESAVIGAIE